MSAEAKHTPGPWQVAEAGSWKDGIRTSMEYFVRRPDDDVGIASEILNPDDSTPSEANALLIAAAPDMLEVLETIENDAGQIPEWLWSRIKAVVVKAKGGAK